MSQENVLLNQSTPPFAPGAPMAADSDSDMTRLTTGDVNNDGHPDIAAAHGYRRAGLYLSNGDRSFAGEQLLSETWWDVAENTGATSIAVEDLDRDGNLDLVIPIYGDHYREHMVQLYRGLGDGTFELWPVDGYNATRDFEGVDQDGVDDGVIVARGAANPMFPLVADFNGDGRPDVVVSGNNGAWSVDVLTQSADQQFSVADSDRAGQNPQYLAAGDFNEDGYPDVVAGVLYTGVLVFLNAADGSGTLHQEGGTYLSDHHHYVVAADFDGDGHLDIAARGNRDRKVFILYGDGTGRFPSTASFSTSGTDGYLAAADIDQDGDSDLVVASKSTKSVDLLLNDGTGQFDAPVSTVLDAAPWGIAADDFDQDGLVDVAVARGDDSVQVLWNRSDTPRVTDGSFSIAENSPDATLLGTVVATDPNVGDTLTYAITAGNGDPDGDGKAAFAIAPATGKITVSDAGDLDFETTATFSLTVTATDADGHVGSGAIAVNLVNVDEPGNEPPVAQDASFTLPENSSNGTEVGAVIATDIDVGDTLSYALTAGNSDPNGDGNPAFVIDPTTGVITVNDSGDLDFETTLSFNLTVKATDAGGLSDTAAVRVDLVNVNELDNNVDQLIFSEAIGNTIDHISPTGDDFEPLVSGLSAPHAIAIDPEAGKLYFTQWSSTEVRRADLDGTHVEDLYPSAGGGGQGIAIDPTRNLVFWGEYYKGLYRGSMDGTQPASLLVSSATLRSAAGAAGLNGVGMGLDVDPAARVVYFFTRDNSSAAGRDIWRVNYDGTGLQKLADLQSTDSMEVDLENRYLYYSDIAGGQEGMYRMGLDNGVKEHLFDLPATCGSIAIDNASNTIFFLTSPGEPTNLGTLWRSNLDGSDRILLKDNLPGGGGVEFLRGAIYITPDDFTVIENSPTDTHVGTVSVQGGSAPLIFAITVGNSDPDGDGQSAFTLDATTGVITVNDAGDLDFETTPGFKLTVTATDPQGHSGRGTITVKLANVDEPGNEPPVAQDATFTLPENSANGTAVGTVIVTDIDAGDTLTYAITAGNSDPNGDSKPAFVINPTTGVITVNDSGDLDFETTPSFDLTVTATDSGGLSDTATIKIDLADIFEREGTAGGDHLGGTAGDDVLSGLAGDDTLTGLAGDDVLDGGDGADRVREQGDVDFTLTDGQLTGLGTDTLVGIERASLNGGVGNNRLDAFGFNRGPVILDGGAGDDLLIGPSLAGGMHRWGLGYNLFIGGEGNDTLTGGVGIDCIKETGDVDFALTGGQLTGRGTDHFSSMELACLVGGAGDNRLDASGFTGSLTMLDGGAGDDTLLGGAALDTLRARGNVDFTLTDTQLSGLGTDTLVTMDSAHLIGGAGDDTLDVSGFSGDRSCLEGGAGDDTLIGRTGGMDRVREHGDVDFTLTDTQLTGRGTDTLVDIERATLIGGAGNNRLDASGFTGRLAVLAGGDRDDTLVGRTGGIDRVGARGNADFTLTDTQLIGQGTDTLVDIDQAMLIGDGDDNTLDASAFTRGRVFLRGESGNDSLTGGTGDDYLSGGVGDDTLVGGAGTDCVEGWGDTDFTLTATQLIGLGTDSLDGIEQAYLCGGPGDNVLDASAFTGSLVTFEGQSGDDTLRGRAGGVDTVRARGDVDFTLTDTQLTGLGTDTLTSIEQAQLLGHSGDNIFDASGFTRGPVNLSGGGGDDTVLGGSGDDSLSGGHGADILVGGLGQDRLAGGLGADTFKFASVAESGITSALRDVITDFDPSQGDKLDLSAIDADTAVAEDQAFASLTEGDAFSGVFANPGELYFDQLGHILYGNHDADGAADFSIQITGVSSLVGTVVL